MDFRIQKSVSYVALAVFFISMLLWYFFIQHNISNRLSTISNDFEQENTRSKILDRMENKIMTVKNKLTVSK